MPKCHRKYQSYEPHTAVGVTDLRRTKIMANDNKLIIVDESTLKDKLYTIAVSR